MSFCLWSAFLEEIHEQVIRSVAWLLRSSWALLESVCPWICLQAWLSPCFADPLIHHCVSYVPSEHCVLLGSFLLLCHFLKVILQIARSPPIPVHLSAGLCFLLISIKERVIPLLLIRHSYQVWNVPVEDLHEYFQLQTLCARAALDFSAASYPAFWWQDLRLFL